MGEAIGKWTGALFLLTMHFSVLHVMDTHSSLLYENPAPLYMALMSCELHTEITNGIRHHLAVLEHFHNSLHSAASHPQPLHRGIYMKALIAGHVSRMP